MTEETANIICEYVEILDKFTKNQKYDESFKNFFLNEKKLSVIEDLNLFCLEKKNINWLPIYRPYYNTEQVCSKILVRAMNNYVGKNDNYIIEEFKYYINKNNLHFFKTIVNNPKIYKIVENVMEMEKYSWKVFTTCLSDDTLCNYIKGYLDEKYKLFLLI